MAISIAMGTQQIVNLTGLDGSSNPLIIHPDVPPTWVSSNTGVLQIQPFGNSVQIVPFAAGTSTLSASFTVDGNPFSHSDTVTVTPTVPVLTTVGFSVSMI